MARPGRRHAHVLVAVALGALLVPSCGIPRDVEGTLDRVEGGTLRVGVIENEPWTSEGRESPTGIEVEIVKELAGELHARPEWIVGADEEIFASLEEHGLDIVIGGLTASSPWGSNITFTQTYATTSLAVGVPEGDPVPEDIAGEEISVEAGSEAEALLTEKTDAVPVAVEDITGSEGPAVVEDWLLDDLDLRDTGIHLIESDHVVAVPNGENAWLVEVENFLLDYRADAAKLIHEADES